MKYKLIKTDLLINGKLIPENSEIELSESDTKGIEAYLIQLETNRHTERSRSMNEPNSHSELASESSFYQNKVEGQSIKETKTKRGTK